MIKLLKNIIYSLILLSMFTDSKEPVKLEKPKKKKKRNSNFIKVQNSYKKIKKLNWGLILTITGIIILFILITLIIYKTGSLESTNYYNNRLIE